MDNPPQNSPEPTLPDESINLRHYWLVLLERRWLAIAAFFSVVVLSLIYVYKAPRVYEAVARLQIDREYENVLNLGEGLSVAGRDQDYLQTQYRILQTRTLIETVVHNLSLHEDPKYKGRPDLVRAVLRDINISPVRLSRLVDIKVRHPQCLGLDPSHGAQMAANIANALAKTFVEKNLDQKRQRLDDALEYLALEAQRLEREVAKSEQNLHDYRMTNKMISLAESENIYVQALREAQTAWQSSQTEAAAAEREAVEVTKLIEAGASPDSLPPVLKLPFIQQIRTELVTAQAALAQLRTRYKDKWPAVIELREKIAKLEDLLQSECRRLYESILGAAKLARSREETLRAEVKEREADQFKLGEMRIHYDELSRKASWDKSAYNMVLQKQKETELTKNDTTQNMRLADPAYPQLRPVMPRVALTLVLGVVAGLALAVGLAFFVNYLDDSIKTQDDVETYLRLPFLGYIPNIKTNSLIERDLQSHLHPRSSAAESFRTIRAAVSLMPRADKYRVLAVTSTIPAEGKTLVAANLAIVFAQTGLKTLLVDADLRRPSVHKMFQLHSPRGLSGYLLEETDNVTDLVHTTEVPHLDVVCCGAIPTTPSELVSSKRMLDFLQDVRGRYDRVVIDCPPISAVSDPLVMASRSDGVVFVTKFNKIRRQHARRTVQRLQDSGIHILGVILNDIDIEGRDSYYYSYYYYQNRYYSSHYKSDKLEPDGKPKDGKPARAAEKPAKEKTAASSKPSELG